MQYLFVKKTTGEWLLSKKPDAKLAKNYDLLFVFPSEHPSALQIVDMIVKKTYITEKDGVEIKARLAKN
jgi:hypothetical protein